jgi:hypothetical protein
MADTPGALQLRLLETIVQVASERNSTLVLPFPVELLRFLENNTSVSTAPSAARTPVDAPGAEFESAASPDNKDRLTNAPEVAALKAREPEQQDQPTARAANRLSPVRQSRPPAKDAG